LVRPAGLEQIRSLVLNICEWFRILTVFVLAPQICIGGKVSAGLRSRSTDLKEPHSQGAKQRWLRPPIWTYFRASRS
jgi:predicted lysophospholipase L1 biosynthesis ABC-type transport system permease subunit